MEWLYLVSAGFFEIVWAISLKYSDSFSKIMPSIITVLAMLASIVLLGIAMRNIPMSIAYTVWTGIGAVGSVIAGIFLFNESLEISKLICLCLIVVGIIGLKLSSIN